MPPEMGSPSDDDEIARLIARARSGDADALDRLLEHCAPRLKALAKQHVSSGQVGHQRRSDILQESALQAFRRFRSFSGSTAPEWDAWLRRIVITRVAQAARSARRLKRDDGKTVPLENVQPRAQQPSPSQSVAADEEWRRVLAHLFELPEPQRQAIWLCHLCDLPISEVARRLGRTEGSAAGHIQRGLKSLHHQLTKGEKPSRREEVDPREDQVAAGLLVYLRSREQSRPLRPTELLARYPDCASELQILLDWIDRIEAQRPQSKDAALPDSP
ncbi:MAG: sigma-70 family RNA polymerase sigma factor [Polyangia bacterium]